MFKLFFKNPLNSDILRWSKHTQQKLGIIVSTFQKNPFYYYFKIEANFLGQHRESDSPVLHLRSQI